MPAVDTIEALTAAAQAFSAQRLGLQMDPDAEAAVRESLQRTGLVLLGEIHGVAQTPVLVEEMIAWFGLGGVALEWHHDLRPWLDRWVAHGVLSDPRWGSALAGEVWGGDGRLTAGHLAVLRRWADSGLLITLMDGTRVVYPRRGESAEELERRSWTERDAAMAGRVLTAPDAVGGRLVVAGHLHTKLKRYRSAFRWARVWLDSAQGCARSTSSTGPAGSTTSVHAHSATACPDSTWTRPD